MSARIPKGRGPRINIGISYATREALDRLSELTGQSMSSIAGGMIDDALPQLLHLVQCIEQAKEDPAAGSSAMHLALIEAQRAALDAQADFLEQLKKPKP
ncbi:hypothetical protein ACFFUA_37590 [Streptomyces heliomycini]|uniref:Uncharacterized protein n=1 Tax=Streptomyces heliomycini TaxID=284032 RepID=A0ABV5LMA5_9ACTN